MYVLRNPTDVKGYQAKLIDLGYSVGPKGADGKLGSDTKAAIQSFQRDNNLPVTGALDAATTGAIDAAASRRGAGAESIKQAAGFDFAKAGETVAQIIPGITGLFGKKEEEEAAPVVTVTSSPDYTVPIIVGVVSLLAVGGIAFFAMRGAGDERGDDE